MVAGLSGPVLAALGVGLALAGAPGPVQAVLLAESVRGGAGRGFRALAGANLTFGALLLCLAFGLSLLVPRGPSLAALRVVGGAFLLWLASDALRSRQASRDRRGHVPVHPAARGALAVVLNPGAWLFLAAVASPLLASAGAHGGRGGAVLVALALMAGAGAGDSCVVLLGGLSRRGSAGHLRRWAGSALAAVLAGFGVWLLVTGVASLVGA